MINIRNGVFETNSSSTHSICISKSGADWPDKICFRPGEYGWEEDCVFDTASYLYMAICECQNSDENLEKLKNILDKHNVEYEFMDMSNYGYIDHGHELVDFVKDILNDEDMLCRFLCNEDSVIYTGNDNVDTDEARKSYAYFDTFYSWEKNKNVPNPYHEPDKYEYYYKGN